MKRPSFQYYPSDWGQNTKLRRCSWAARGAWIEVMGLFHDSDQYGLLRWTLKEIAQAVGCPLPLVKELVSKEVLKGTDKGFIAAYTYTPKSGRKAGPTVTLLAEQEGPLWYSSRMVRDEYIRLKKANMELYKHSPNAAPDNRIDDGFGGASDNSPMPPIGELSGDAPMPPKSDLPTSSSSPSVNKTTPYPAEAGLPAASRKSGIRLQTFLDECKTKGERPMRDYTPLWDYAQSAGIDGEFVALAWAEFCRRFLPGGAQEAKTQKNWRSTFRKYVEGNYFKLWAIDQNGAYFLTSQGKQAAKFQESKAAA